MERTLEKLKTLKNEEFKFDREISKVENGCGAVCCIIGWFPQWFPEMGFVWTVDNTYKTLMTYYHGKPLFCREVSQIYDLTLDETNYLFFGDTENNDQLPTLNNNSNLKEVINAWEEFIRLRKKEEKEVNNILNYF